MKSNKDILNDQIMDTIIADKHTVIQLCGGPYTRTRVILHDASAGLLMRYIDDELNILCEARYDNVGIQELGIWRYEWQESYRVYEDEESDDG